MGPKERRGRPQPAPPPRDRSFSRPNAADIIARHARQQRRRCSRRSRATAPCAAGEISDAYKAVAQWLTELGDDEVLDQLRHALISGDPDRACEARAFITRLASAIVRGIALDLCDARPLTALRDAQIVAAVLAAIGRKDASLWRGVAAYLACGADDVGVEGMAAEIMPLGVAALHVAEVG